MSFLLLKFLPGFNLELFRIIFCIFSLLPLEDSNKIDVYEEISLETLCLSI